MSELPSFDEETPIINIIDPSTSPVTTSSSTDTEDIENNLFVCKYCGDTFQTSGARGSHETHKHRKPNQEDIQKIYKEGDIIRLLLPQSTARIFDQKTKNWVSTLTANIPDDFVLYDIITKDKVYAVSDATNEKRSFMEVLCIRKDKVVVGLK